MSDWIGQYIKTVKHLFPIMGKPERTYLKRLRANIEDFFKDRPPGSMEMVSDRFGPPEDIVDSYLTSLDPDDVLKRMEHAKRWRFLSRCALVLLCVVVVFFVYRLWYEYATYIRFMKNTYGYFIETIE